MPFPKRLLTTVYFCTFILCASVGLWDVHLIIKNYIFDNRMTLVGIRSVEDHPFVSKAQICLKYNDRPLLPVSHEHFRRLAISYWFDREAFVELTYDFTEADRQFTEALFELIVPYSYFYYLDEYGNDQVFEDTFGLNQSEISQVVGSFFANPNYLIQMDRNWRTIQPYFIRVLGNDAPFRLDYIYTNQDMICVTAPLFLNESVYARPYQLDYTRDNNETTSSSLWNVHTSTATVMVRFISDVLETIIEAGPSSATTTAFLTLTNAGVSNMKRLRPCQDEFESDEECQTAKHVATMEQFCQCRQFWYYHRRGHPSVSRNSDIPFCTYDQHYQGCFKQADRISRIQRYKDPRYCSPCEFSKTNYHLETQLQSKTAYKFDEELYPRNVLKFICHDRFYLYFEERPQFVLSQLIAQIGGNLGLYIGFSMMSILQLVTTLCRHCTSTTNGTAASQQSHRESPLVGRSFESTIQTVQYFLESFAGTEDPNSAAGTSEQLKDVMRAMQKNNERLEVMERNMAILLQKKEGEHQS